MKPRTTGAAVAIALASALVLTACGGEDDAPPASVVDRDDLGAADPETGTVLDTPFAKPALTLTDTDGEEYDLVAETEGVATLLYFGYTNCPDVCPLTMSNIANAAAELTEEQRERLNVVMVTSDPERDTPESLGAWLQAQDPDFIGLTGDFGEIQEAASSLGVLLEEPYVEDDGAVVSSHGSQVLAFLPGDDKAHVLYTEGVTTETFERDLPVLIEGETP
ncbi:SCO family protein [Streptomyces bohaiensis]|uniref:SCO family protein n=1 Tax=Streptomyces bohaiensis TaxID=1431344 RepID=A0ABX1CCD7_9ACTN|nr:SCO family protein [Streptomyces bohaiensis]NJQ16772.1 SCO family protein [Streptomyces bohaiensis]